jgi:multiple sugar transport system permease protein
MTATASAPEKPEPSTPVESNDKPSNSGVDGGWKVAIWFLLPSLIGFLIFYLVPTVRAIAISFQNFNLLKNEGTPAGLDNYRFIFGDDVFWNAIKVTAYYVAINIGLQTVLALGIASMMDRLTKSVFVRGILLLPWMLPNVLVGLLWLFMLDPSVGIVNEALGFFGIRPIAFLSSTGWVIPSLAVINTWKFTGYTALLLFAGMQTIPRSLYEASALDGASEFTMFRTVTLPLLRPVLALVLVISVIGSFQVYDVVISAAGGLGGNPGDPLNASRVIYLYIYEKGFLGGGSRFGQAAAAATVLMGGLLVITIAQLRLLRAGESDLA